MTLPETFCVYAIINHSRRELYYGLHDRDAATGIIRGHEAGQVKGTRHWFPCEPEEVELDILKRGLSLEHAAALEFQLLRMDLGELLKGWRGLRASKGVREQGAPAGYGLC